MLGRSESPFFSSLSDNLLPTWGRLAGYCEAMSERDEAFPSRTFTEEGGVRIHYYTWTVDKPRAVVQLVHGVGEHALRYVELATTLNAAGYSVYADDHLGHGRTGAEQHGGDLTQIGKLGPGGVHGAINAVHQFSGVISAENVGVPLVILGHSWGSFMTQIIINKHAADYAAVILSGTALRMPGFMDAGDLNRRHKGLGATGLEWLSRDPAVAAAFVADPLTTPVPLQKLFGMTEALKLMGLPARNLPADLPLLVQIGSDDIVGGERSALRLVEAYRSRSMLDDVTLIVYPDARHEVFNETNRVEVMADTIAWLDQRFPAQP